VKEAFRLDRKLPILEAGREKPMGELYDADILEWSEHQARLLRQHAAGVVAKVPPAQPVEGGGGEASNEAPDWPNIVEEITSLGRSQLHAVESLLVQALLHDLKCEAWPLAREVPHWRAEARGFRRDARRIYTPSMRYYVAAAPHGSVTASPGPERWEGGEV